MNENLIHFRSTLIASIVEILKRHENEIDCVSQANEYLVIIPNEDDGNKNLILRDIKLLEGESFQIGIFSCCEENTLNADDLDTDTLSGLLDFLKRIEEDIWGTDEIEEKTSDTDTVFVLTTASNDDGCSNAETIGVYARKEKAREELKHRRDIFVKGLEEGERLEDLDPGEDGLTDTEDLFAYNKFSHNHKFQLIISKQNIIK